MKSIILRCLLLSVAVCHLVGCAKNNPDVSSGTFRVTDTITVDGRARTYTVNLPPGYYRSGGFSLVIAMHGGGGDAAQFEATSKLTEKANASGFVVVYPNGVKSTGLLGAQTWNAGGCCDYARDNNVNDVKFISQLIDHLIATYKINAKRVYATGHSNGGMLSYRLACELSTKVAAIAPNGCSMVVLTACSPARPVPVLHMHSLQDEKVPVEGGVGISGAYYPPIDSVMKVWASINACGADAEVTKYPAYQFKRWSGCSAGADLQYYLTKDGGHAWPGGLPGGGINSDTPSAAINANDLLWSFFQQYQLP